MYVGVCPMVWRSVGMNMWRRLSIRMSGGERLVMGQSRGRISGVGIIDVGGIRECICRRNVMDSGGNL